jgi:hypothetical protein
MKLVRHSGLSNRGIASLVIEGLYELDKEGFGDDCVNAHWEDKSVVFYDGGKPFGFITYTVEKGQNYLFIKLAYIKKDYRKFGRYHMMLSEIHQIAIEEKVSRIMCVIDPRHELSIAIAEKRGYKHEANTYIFTLKTEEEKKILLEEYHQELSTTLDIIHIQV